MRAQFSFSKSTAPIDSLESRLCLSSADYAAVICADDFTGDGNIDLLVSPSSYSQTLKIIPGKGDGTFSDPIPTNLPSYNDYAAGDINGDGRADALVIDRHGLSISLGKGNGQFGRSFRVKDRAIEFLFFGYVNSDSMLDMIIQKNSNAFYYRGKGNGDFAPPKKITLPSRYDILGAADFTGDGSADLLIGRGDKVKLMRNSGNGNFKTLYGEQYIYGALVAVADFDGDAKADLLVRDHGYHSVFFSVGNGTFSQSDDSNVAYNNPFVADLNNDGYADLIHSGDYWYKIAFQLGAGDGSFGDEYEI